MSSRYQLLYLLFAAVMMVPVSCSSPAEPEQIALEFIDEATTVFEKGSLRALRKLISRNYRDSQKRNHEQIAAIGSAYIMRSKSIFLFSELESARQLDSQVQATVLTAFAARPVDSRNLLPQIQADLYWFDIVLTKEGGEWKLLSSSWRQAMLEDIFND